MIKSQRILLIAGLAIIGLAAVLLYRHFSGARSTSEQAFFYDVSERKLFSSARTAIPPIRGLNNAEEDAFRAVVISTNGNSGDQRSWTIAYLEKYSSELKAQMQKAQQTGTPPEMSRAAAQHHRFVRRLSDRQWFPLSSPQGESIVTEWASPNPNGVTPIVCSP